MQTICDGRYNYEELEQVAKACEGIDLTKKTRAVIGQLDNIAKELKTNRSTLRRMARVAEKVKIYPLRLTGPDTLEIPVANVISANGFDSACKCALRTYRGTLRNLELRGYALTDGTNRHEINLAQ